MYIFTTNTQHEHCQITAGSTALCVTPAYACTAYELRATGITHNEPFHLSVKVLHLEQAFEQFSVFTLVTVFFCCCFFFLMVTQEILMEC